MARVLYGIAVGMFFIVPSFLAEPLAAAVESTTLGQLKDRIVNAPPQFAGKMTVSNRAAGRCERCINIYLGQTLFGFKEIQIFSITAEELLALDSDKKEEIESTLVYVNLDHDPSLVVFKRSYPVAEFFRMVFTSPRGATIDLLAPPDDAGRASTTFRMPPLVGRAQRQLLREFYEFIYELPQAKGRLTFSYYYLE